MPRQKRRSQVSTDSPYSGIRYSRNFLTEVIVRIDFLMPLEGITSKLPPSLMKGSKKRFPLAEPQQKVEQEFQISIASNEAKSSRSSEISEWIFYSTDRKKVLKIAPQTLLISYKDYASYNQLREDFDDILGLFFTAYVDAQPHRLGLRYVNSIGFSEGHPLEWNGLLNSRLLGLFDFVPKSENLSRLFHVIEFNDSQSNLRFQFGMPNPDYPAIIRQKLFILDFDAYYQGLIEKEELADQLDRSHIKIQELFELSITDNLRTMMNEKR